VALGFEDLRLGLVNQLLSLTRALQEACRRSVSVFIDAEVPSMEIQGRASRQAGGPLAQARYFILFADV
jgi:hypothetical protein